MKYDFKKLRKARQEQLLTLTEVARRAGVSVSAVHQVEKGKVAWVTAIRKIAAVLEVTDVVKRG